jgi:hypothetical protein
MVDTMADMHA